MLKKNGDKIPVSPTAIESFKNVATTFSFLSVVVDRPAKSCLVSARLSKPIFLFEKWIAQNISKCMKRTMADW